MRDKYFLAWGRDADENGPERDIESYFVELEILSVNGHDIEQKYNVLSSLDELELRDTVFFKTLDAPRITTRRYVPTLRARKLGSTGVEIK